MIQWHNTVIYGSEQTDADPRSELIQRLVVDGEIVIRIWLEVDIL